MWIFFYSSYFSAKNFSLSNYFESVNHYCIYYGYNSCFKVLCDNSNIRLLKIGICPFFPLIICHILQWCVCVLFVLACAVNFGFYSGHFEYDIVISESCLHLLEVDLFVLADSNQCRWHVLSHFLWVAVLIPVLLSKLSLCSLHLACAMSLSDSLGLRQ